MIQPPPARKIKRVPWDISRCLEFIGEQLEKDYEFYYSYQANAAMAYKDHEFWYRAETGKKTLNKKDKHIIANRAAKHFINTLFDIKTPKELQNDLP